MENLAHDPAGRRTPRPVRPVRATLGAWLVLLAGVVGLFGVVLGGTIASGEWLATAERPDGSTAFDRSVTSWMVDHRASGVTFVARVFTAVGSQKALVPIVAIMALVLIRRRGWCSLGLLGVAWGGAILLYSLAKHAVGRPRPPADLWLMRVCGNAFPSGHAVQSLSTFVALAVIAATLVRPSHRLLWTAAAILLATGVGLSRIYLGVHWATDVIAGWGAAALWVTVLVWLFDRVWRLPSRDERGPASRRGPPQARQSTIIQARRGEPGDVGHD
jgi:membrane-associated phospholipid phosphatase